MKIKLLHRWTGLLISVAIIIMSFSGVLLVWKKEYLWLTIPQARDVVVRDNTLIAETLNTIDQSYAENEVRFVQLYSERLAIHKVFLKNKHYAWHDQNGVKIQQWTNNERWEDWLLDLHHRFLLGNTIGLNIAGFSGLLMIPLIFVGIFIWWPRRRTFKLGVWPKNLQRGVLQRSHGNIGAASALLVLLIAITGVILVYPTESRQVLVEPFTGTDRLQHEQQLDSIRGIDSRDWLQVLNRVTALYPGSELRWASFPSKDSNSKSIGLQQQADWNTSGQTSISIDNASGEMLSNSNALLRPTAVRLTDFSYPLHTGKLGLWYRILLSIFGVAMMLLTSLGVLSYLRRTR